MHFQLITLFPDLFEPFSSLGLVGRAREDGLIRISPIMLRDFAINTHGQVDDTPYGGGSGMVLRPEPAVAAIESAKETDRNATVILCSPRGRVFNRSAARELYSECLEKQGGIVILCPRYEGVDERIAEWVDLELSLGDFVLMGGEVAAMAIIETITRFIPGVLGNPESLEEESFEQGLLEYPQYTKPQEYRGLGVPPVLLSGHHAEIKKWRHHHALKDTRERRPDLIKDEPFHAEPQCSSSKEPLDQGAPGRQNASMDSDPPPQCDISLALIHYPVMDKGGRIVTASVTNLDLHDIARSAKTFGISRFYVVHPSKTIRKLLQRICDHWFSGFGLAYNENRSEALEVTSLVPDFDDVLLDIEARTGSYPVIVSTSAKGSAECVSFSELRRSLSYTDQPHLILLGTGWGLADDILDRARLRLEPIRGYTDYNHLSVRAAASIILDRLLGKRSADHRSPR